jgi:putative ABC transport system permease protein
MTRFGRLLTALDLKIGFRMLKRYPGLTAVATLGIAFAIALSAIYFEGVDKWQNPRLPVRDAERIVSISNYDVAASATEQRLLQDFAQWREQLTSVDNLGAAIPFVRNLATADGRIEPVSGAELTANAFRLLGTPPLLGRVLVDADEQPAEPPVIVLSHAVWASRFSSDPSVVGQVAKLGSVQATIVGVMPEGFGFPVNQRIWMPLRTDGAALEPRTGPFVSVFGRLAPGKSIDDARAELEVAGARMAASNPQTHEHLRPRIMPYAKPDFEGGEFRRLRGFLYIVNGVFLMLLAIVCINVATLVFARTATRSWEITVRSALGASRRRIIGQLFTEALLLAGIAGVVGLLFAKGAMTFGLATFAASDLPFWIDAALSWKTVLYTAGLMLFVAAIVGIFPALRVTRVSLRDALHGDAAAGLKFGGFWTTVVVVQVAITVLFLPLAARGVFAANRFSERAAAIGAENYLTAGVAIDGEDYGLDAAELAQRARRSFGELELRLSAEPGVERVAFANPLPVDDQVGFLIAVDDPTVDPPAEQPSSTLVQVSQGFFAAFGTSVVAGREFTPLDFEKRDVVIVNESFATNMFGQRSAVGRRVRIVAGDDGPVAGEPLYEIVGVVNDFGWQPPEPQYRSAMYRPSLPTDGSNMSVAVRVRNPESFATRLRAIAAEVDPTIRLTDVQTLDKVGGRIAEANWTLTSVAWVVGFMVLLLSAMGIHALMSFTVARRTREIGIRAALGARSNRIVGGVFSRAFFQIGAGVLVGSALAALAGLGTARDVLLLLASDGIMLLVGLIACVVPVQRALRIDPTEAMRAER